MRPEGTTGKMALRLRTAWLYWSSQTWRDERIMSMAWRLNIAQAQSHQMQVGSRHRTQGSYHEEVIGYGPSQVTKIIPMESMRFSLFYSYLALPSFATSSDASFKDSQSVYIMEQEITIEGPSFDCLECNRKAHHPVLTRCGHLYCWKCFYLLTQRTEQCSLCKTSISQDDIYPLFIENEQLEPEEDEGAIPDRPPPTNTPKIANANIISAAASNIRDNLVMGRPFAGTPLMPGLGITTWSQMGQIQEGQPQKSVSFCMKLLFIALLSFLSILWVIQLA